IFMEFVPGGSISSIIHRFGPLPEIVFCKYTTQILQGVAYLHENRVVHRDIKGNNVMLMPNGVIKLIDFGCAKRLAWVSLNGTQSEMLNSVHGTPYWMAPEVINESGYGRKSDIWSIGCTVFEMATGKPPLASMNRILAVSLHQVIITEYTYLAIRHISGWFPILRI
uniref:Protein kinase domain-containing protein n=1 Tax=Crocodylus porosus TaxID=8502 RepID=A0A7M4E6U1_CROPO